MNMKLLILAILILAIGVSCADPFDYLLFVQEVPGTVCHMKRCKSHYGKMLDKQLNMHGMWPNYSNGSWPASCYHAHSYSDNDISKSVLDDLNDRWIGLFSSVQSFRNHEWLKHGTCYIQGLQNEQNLDADMNKYFKDTMDTQKKLDLSSIVFSKSHWNKNDLEKALSEKVGGKKIYFDCNGKNLYNIKTCLDRNLNIIDCPNSVSGGGKCRSSIAVPDTPKDLIKNGTGPGPTPSKVFDFLLFVQESTGAACLKRNCSSAYGTIKQNTLNMHGMWPNFEKGGYPQNCYKAQSYSDDLIEPSTLSLVKDNWIGVFADGEVFRNHEWTKHGTCYIKGVENKTNEMNSVDKQMDKYFADALHTKIQLNLDSLIFSKSSWEYYDFYSTIKNKIGHDFQMDCDKQNNLLELKICLAPDLKVRDCPTTLYSHKKCKSYKNINILPVPDSIVRKTTNDEQNVAPTKKFLEQ